MNGLAKQESNVQTLAREMEQTQELLLEKYIQLGKSIYEVADRSVDDINRLTDRLIDIKRNISMENGQTECTECLAMNPRENVYCGRCGSKLHRAGEEDEESGK